MPLYEFVLRFRDRDEIRLGDRNGYQAGGEIVIAGRRFLVIGHEPPEHPNADERLVLEPAPMDNGHAGSNDRVHALDTAARELRARAATREAARQPGETMEESRRLAVASRGDGFRLTEPFPAASHVRAVAAGSNHGAPQRLQPRRPDPR